MWEVFNFKLQEPRKLSKQNVLYILRSLDKNTLRRVFKFVRTLYHKCVEENGCHIGFVLELKKFFVYVPDIIKDLLGILYIKMHV